MYILLYIYIYFITYIIICLYILFFFCDKEQWKKKSLYNNLFMYPM